MVEKLKELNEKLINNYQNDSINLEKHKLIEQILNEDKFIFKIDIETAYAILRDLTIKEEDLEKVYSELIDIDNELIISYEHYLKTEGVQHNTISFYMHRLRAVYNKAVDQELIEQKYPFKQIKIGIEKTIKRAIPIKYIKRLKALELKEFSSKDLARDIFLFSFYTRGMSFIDIAYLQKSDLKNGTLSYRRKKTGQKLYIKWESCMELIANKYSSKDSSPFIFSILPKIRNYHPIHD